MMALLNALKDEIAKLLAGETFSDPQGGSIEPRFFVGIIPPKRTDTAQGEDAPFCAIFSHDYSNDRDGVTQAVTVEFTMHTAGDHNQLMSDLDHLILLLIPLARKQLAGCRLAGDIAGSMPDPKHPFYFLRLQMDYRSPTTFTC